MLKARLIPAVLIRQGLCVQSRRFQRYQALGNPFTIVQRLSTWASDELIYLDITRDGTYDLRRDDTNFANRDTIEAIIQDVADRCFMPLTVGGGIRSLDHMRSRLASGADKVALNTLLATGPGVVTNAAEEFGSQCIVASIDVRRPDGGPGEVFVEGGRQSTGADPVRWATRAQDLGAGEILLNSIDRDGQGSGYDLDLIARVAAAVTIPVIALGGVGSWEHLAAGLDAGADAVAAANIFHHTEASVMKAKTFLHESGRNVRAPELHAEVL